MRVSSERPVRLKDIAKSLGISAAAVSKALRDAGDISPALKKMVLKRARELNYQPDLVARSLATRRTYAVGLVVPDLSISFFADIAKGVARLLQPRGYTLVLVISEEDPALERREIEHLLARRVDGMILASAQPAAETSLFERIRRARTPFVLVDRAFPSLAADFSGVDNVELGCLATEHLIQLGCRRIAHLACCRISTGPGRREGYRRALKRHGLAAPHGGEVEVENSIAGGRAGAARLLAGAQFPDGLFCFSDPVAAGAELAILEAGLRVPRDVAIMGAGNVQFSDMLRVPLSTVDMRSGDMGERAAEFLLERMEASHCAPRCFSAPLEILARDSTARTSSSRRAGQERRRRHEGNHAKAVL